MTSLPLRWIRSLHINYYSIHYTTPSVQDLSTASGAEILSIVLSPVLYPIQSISKKATQT